MLHQLGVDVARNLRDRKPFLVRLALELPTGGQDMGCSLFHAGATLRRWISPRGWCGSVQKCRSNPRGQAQKRPPFFLHCPIITKYNVVSHQSTSILRMREVRCRSSKPHLRLCWNICCAGPHISLGESERASSAVQQLHSHNLHTYLIYRYLYTLAPTSRS